MTGLVDELEALIPFLESHHCSAEPIRKAIAQMTPVSPDKDELHDGDNRSGCTTCWDISCEGCATPDKDEVELKARFFAKVPVRDAIGCWNWCGTMGTRGYGTMRVGGKQKRATHVAVFLDTGAWPEAGMVVCHKCDNPACVRPAHLFVGTQSDNMRDCVAKGRFATRVIPAETKVRGAKHPASKLTDEKVREILSATESQAEIGARYGVDQKVVQRIKAGTAWAHVERPSTMQGASQ